MMKGLVVERPNYLYLSCMAVGEAMGQMGNECVGVLVAGRRHMSTPDGQAPHGCRCVSTISAKQISGQRLRGDT